MLWPEGGGHSSELLELKGCFDTALRHWVWAVLCGAEGIELDGRFQLGMLCVCVILWLFWRGPCSCWPEGGAYGVCKWCDWSLRRWLHRGGKAQAQAKCAPTASTVMRGLTCLCTTHSWLPHLHLPQSFAVAAVSRTAIALKSLTRTHGTRSRAQISRVMGNWHTCRRHEKRPITLIVGSSS